MSRRWQLLSPLALDTLTACSTSVEMPQATSTGAAPTAVASVNFPSATVVSVGDGDTMRVNYQGQTLTPHGLHRHARDCPDTLGASGH